MDGVRTQVERKLYTLAEANAVLPLIKQQLATLQALVDEMESGYVKLERIKSARHASSSQSGPGLDPYFEQEGRLEFKRMEAELLMNNFERQGVQLKMINPGLLDFPAVIDGEDVLLCWKEGEESITHYHGWHDGFIGRKPIADSDSDL
jgi:hypothetical protein